MHSPQQITPFTCGLACIESFCCDVGINVTQCDILKGFKILLIQSCQKFEEFGSTPPITMRIILNTLGVDVADYKEHDKAKFLAFLKQMPAEKGLLLFANINGAGNHCVRWAGLKDDDTLLALDPGFFLPHATIQEYSLENLIQWGYSGFLLTKK